MLDFASEAKASRPVKKFNKHYVSLKMLFLLIQVLNANVGN